MKSYLNHSFSTADPDLISVIDELPLWSAPFGLKLLDNIRIKRNMRVLDIGCGLGFPLVELSQRLGNSSMVVGLDPWIEALNRVSKKIKKFEILNAHVIDGIAESIPVGNNCFDIIVSNNGINNVKDIYQTLSECNRVCKLGGQLLFTMNLDNSMHEFYSLFEEVLVELKYFEGSSKIKDHIFQKRKPLELVESLIKKAGFSEITISRDQFELRFADSESLFGHSLIKYWFLPSWKMILTGPQLPIVFEKLENRLNEVADEYGEIRLTVPFVTINCVKT